MPTIQAQVIAVSSETPFIKSITLSLKGNKAIEWQAGSHLRVQLIDGSSRAYSLLRLPDLGANEIALGVLLEQKSTGGSKFMHALKPGDTIKISPPANQFPLGTHAEHAVLIAGGIGITPILSMAADLAAEGRPFQAHYAGRTEGALAFVPEMHSICGDALQLWHAPNGWSGLIVSAS